MHVRLLTSAEDLQAYDAWVKAHPQGTLWQSLAWRDYQKQLGREVKTYAINSVPLPLPLPSSEKGTGKEFFDTTAQVIIDRTSGGYSTWDIPRGPIGEAREELLEAIASDARTEKCLVLFCSPPLPLRTPRISLLASSRHEQPEATRIIDLTLDDNALLAQMKPKGRYNIEVAKKYALEVRESQDIDAFYALLQKTGGRDGFGIGPKSRYKAFLEHIPGAFLLLCYHTTTSDTEPIAGLLGAVYGATGIYYYGASSYEHRALMAPYLIQWEAMKKCQALGCTTYDLLGVAPPVQERHGDPAERGESMTSPIRQAQGDEHPWAGISSFKEKFGGTLVHYPQEQAVILRPMLWRLLQLKRRLVG